MLEGQHWTHRIQTTKVVKDQGKKIVIEENKEQLHEVDEIG